MTDAETEPSGSAAPPPLDSSIDVATFLTELVVGTRVVFRTTLGETIVSTVFEYDPITACVMLREPGAHNGVATLRILRTTCISEVISVERPAPGRPPDVLDYAGGLPEVCPEKGKRREERALLAAQMEADRVGEGVTKETQMVFEALAKTMPCRWQGKSILVLDLVTVNEPYTAEAATAAAAHTSTLLRVQKVLNAERERLGM